MNQAHVIMLNDSVQHVVIGDFAKAEGLLLKLRDDYYKSKSWQFKSWLAYKQQCYWHIKTVKCDILTT